MDLLGSIMNSMDKPPSMSEKERLLLKKRKQEVERRQNEEKEKLKRFKARVEAKLVSHFKDPKNAMLKFESMDQICRNMKQLNQTVYFRMLLEVTVLTGTLEYTKRKMLHVKMSSAARRRGEPWNEEIKKQLIEKRNQQKLKKPKTRNKKHEKKFVPNSNYKDKYAHLIGQDAALEAAKKTETNKSYGFVPSENKKDIRSIEQTMADIRAKKRQKLNNEGEAPPH
ncbi:hypothetical protein NQ317_001237 [Molorchus minor]|uniref:Uncharacterized protein n=1 Tax=Molorchus minor TaxID=1323400 RepID=A0ABQ9JD05_9CUCU|nr:hypothetical protein NQ317_001237 [Molorchus minor]